MCHIQANDRPHWDPVADKRSPILCLFQFVWDFLSTHFWSVLTIIEIEILVVIL